MKLVEFRFRSISMSNNKEAKFPPLFWFHFFGLALPTTYEDGENKLKSGSEAVLFTDQSCYAFYYSCVPEYILDSPFQDDASSQFLSFAV
jgi:hypothetical protein